jgi:hypothetical protein
MSTKNSKVNRSVIHRRSMSTKDYEVNRSVYLLTLFSVNFGQNHALYFNLYISFFVRNSVT